MTHCLKNIIIFVGQIFGGLQGRLKVVCAFGDPLQEKLAHTTFIELAGLIAEYLGLYAVGFL